MTRKTVGLASLARQDDAIQVEVRIGQFRYTIDDVPANIVRCAIGEDDMAYLLGEQPDPEWKPDDDPEDEFVVPARDESQCFRISTKEFKDMMRHGTVQRDFSGRAGAVFARR